MTEQQFRKIKIGMGAVFAAAMLLLSRRTAEYIVTDSANVVIHRDTIGLAEDKKTDTPDEKKHKLLVVIDAGHGWIDPGKVGINKALEKDINLLIARKVKRY